MKLPWGKPKEEKIQLSYDDESCRYGIKPSALFALNEVNYAFSAGWTVCTSCFIFRQYTIWRRTAILPA